MSGAERRKKIIDMIREASAPLSGGALGKAVGVSRQVVVQDIALLRTEGYPILATARGYILDQPKQAVRRFKMFHTNELTEKELTTIVDLGGCVQDVMVNHRVYGRISAPLNIKNRRDVQHFMENLRSGKVEINDLTATVKRANELVEECRRQLSLTRHEIERITTSTPF